MNLRLKILLWTCATLTLAVAAFIGISFLRAFANQGPGLMLAQLADYQLAEARRTFETGGTAALHALIQRTNSRFTAEHHLTDARGQDLVTGQSLAHLLEVEPMARPYRRAAQLVLAADSADHRYRWIIIRAPPIDAAALAMNLLVVLAAVALLSWALATHIARPLVAMTRTLQRFGDGALGLRLHSTRRDEIGQLSRAFDQMAGRIEHLVALERQLLQDISHELRSPLARLSVAAQLTRQPAEREPATRQIEKEIHRLDALIGDLVASTRLEAGPPQLLPLKPLLHDIISDCRLEAAAKRCRIVKRLDPSPVLELIPELLRRALENVLRNAVRHAPEASAIDIELLEDYRHVEIAIRDRGAGVPPHALERIFQPFYRLDEARAGHTGGVGLGLAIAQRAVSLHHGSVTAENASPGLRVTIILPLPLEL